MSGRQRKPTISEVSVAKIAWTRRGPWWQGHGLVRPKPERQRQRIGPGSSMRFGRQLGHHHGTANRGATTIAPGTGAPTAAVSTRLRPYATKDQQIGSSLSAC